MPRRARQKSHTGIYHVMLRGNNRATIFHDDEDCERFLEDLRKCLVPEAGANGSFPAGRDGSSAGRDGSFLPLTRDEKTVPPATEEKTVPSTVAPIPAEVYVYCLMGNHVHLLLREGSEDISRMMKRVGIRFASFYKWKYQHTGHVFQDRFRSEPINDDKYFLAVYRYIVLNPVKAGLSEQIGGYPWCSYRGVSAGRDGSFLPLTRDEKTVPPAACLHWGQSPMLPVLPVDITPGHLDAFIRSVQPELHPFRERISDREAEAVLRQIAGLDSAAEFIRLPKAEQRRLIPMLYDNDLSIPQIARLTGIAKSNIARYL